MSVSPVPIRRTYDRIQIGERNSISFSPRGAGHMSAPDPDLTDMRRPRSYLIPKLHHDLQVRTRTSLSQTSQSIIFPSQTSHYLKILR